MAGPTDFSHQRHTVWKEVHSVHAYTAQTPSL